MTKPTLARSNLAPKFVLRHACFFRSSFFVIRYSLTLALLTSGDHWANALADQETTQPKVGPARGTLVVHGGGKLTKEFVSRFVELAGGSNAPLVVLPTAGETDEYSDDWPGLKPWIKAEVKHITLLHTRDRAEANSPEFVRPLETARAVWITGGRQWRLADVYLATRTEQALRGVLDRGGVIGGSSAGATIQGSYLVRGSPGDNTIMMSPGHEQGFGYLRQVAIDQHLLTRHRARDMLSVIAKHPELLGIGIDEQTAIVVHGDIFTVIGSSRVAIYDPGYSPPPDGEPYYFLQRDDQFDLAHRRTIGKADAPQDTR
jgi:cyanophycinase